MVADPLELVGDVIEGQQVAQVPGDRLLRSDGHRDQARHAALGLVDDRVALDHVERELRVVRREGPAGLANGRLHQGAHPEHGIANQLFLAVQCLARGRMAVLRRVVATGLGHDLVDLRVHVGLPGSRLIGHRGWLPLIRTGRTRSPRSAGSSGW